MPRTVPYTAASHNESTELQGSHWGAVWVKEKFHMEEIFYL